MAAKKKKFPFQTDDRPTAGKMPMSGEMPMMGKYQPPKPAAKPRRKKKA